MSEYAPIRGKCFYWREAMHGDDMYDVRVKKGQRRVVASCFVEGNTWTFTESDIPADCPHARQCRYFIFFS